MVHPLDIGHVVNRVARFVGGSQYSHHVSVFELVSKSMRAHFNAKLRLEIHLLGVLEYSNRRRAAEEEDLSPDSDNENFFDPYYGACKLTWEKQGPNKWEQVEEWTVTEASCRHWSWIPQNDEGDY